MAFEQRSLDDYIDVAQRIADFRAAYPDGSLRPWNPAEPWRIVQAMGYDKDGSEILQSFIVVVAAAYRAFGDENPGVGMAWEIFPGRTPYTRGSELQNAETSAWGRAIIAVGASDSKRGIASREEVRNRQAERDDGLPANRDGSTSRSRVTDDQLEQTGQMTRAQLSEANALAKPPANAGPVDRLGMTPVDDAWYDAPAPLADLQNPEDRHGTATADQIKALHARMAAKNIAGAVHEGSTTRDAKIAWLRERFGADIRSSKDLSYTQAAQALQELTR